MYALLRALPIGRRLAEIRTQIARVREYRDMDYSDRSAIYVDAWDAHRKVFHSHPDPRVHHLSQSAKDLEFLEFFEDLVVEYGDLLLSDDVDSQERLDLLKIIKTQESRFRRIQRSLIYEKRPAVAKDDFVSQFISTYLANLSDRSAISRAASHVTRVVHELHRAEQNRWFVIFNTLTVEAREYDKVFGEGSLEFQKYTQRLRRYLSPHGIKLRYCKVNEEGSQFGRLHVHLLMVLEDLPPDWRSDPNSGRRIPYCREIHQLKEFWPHGYSVPLAVRVGSGDAFTSRLRWRWPSSSRYDDVPIPSSSYFAVASYVGKYITKQVTAPSSDYRYRIGFSRGFGKSYLTVIFSQCTLEEMEHLLRSARHVVGHRDPHTGKDTRLWLLNRPVTASLLRQVLIPLYLRRLLAFNKAKPVFQFLASQSPQMNIVKRLRKMLGFVGKPLSVEMLRQLGTTLGVASCTMWLTNDTSHEDICRLRDKLSHLFADLEKGFSNVVTHRAW